jgi:ABC-type lipoprotein release transport system permease subunit
MTGRVVLLSRLVARDLRHRSKVELALLLLVIAVTTGTLVLGLALGGVTSSPYAYTKAVTAGPDVTVQSAGTAPDGAPPASLTALEHAPGVTGFSGPYVVASPALSAGGHAVPSGAFSVLGRSERRAAVDQPKVIQGHWVSPGGVVVEVTYARELGVTVGSRLMLNGRYFKVVGLAVTAAWPSVNYPGLLWSTQAAARAMITKSESASYLLNLKLARPGTAAAFAGALDHGNLYTWSWQQISAQDAKQLAQEEVALGVGAWLLSLLAIASVAVIAGGRMAEQRRRVGLLKAVGGTPGLIARVLLAEHVVLAMAAAGLGLGLGWLVTPLLGNPVDGLIGPQGSPSITGRDVGLALALALTVALLSTFLPALRAARTSTVSALADAPRRPRRRRMLIAFSRRLPVPWLIGLRLAARRPRRLMLSAASTAITVALIVAVVDVHDRSRVSRVPGGLVNPVRAGLDQVITVITVVMVVLAAINAIFVAWTTAIDARQPLAVSRSLGATSEQVAGALTVAQVFAAVPGALVGIPAGMLLIEANIRAGSPVFPSAAALIAVWAGAVAAVAALAAVTAWLCATRPAAAILQAELA